MRSFRKWDVEAAMNLASDAVTTDPDIEAFFCVNDNMAISVANREFKRTARGSDCHRCGRDHATYESHG